ncbi:MAG: diguanylate cyclase [Bacteroidetes bacterium]|nr:diguanylate cyclase [Bacteroidota bacterium]
MQAQLPVDPAPATSLHLVRRLRRPTPIDAQWDKPMWAAAEPLRIRHQMGSPSAFTPTVEAKLAYDKANVYVIFRVQDRFVRSLVQEYNGNVSGDSCVEFFFAPDAARPLCYFNLEVNAGGTPLIFYIQKPMSDVQRLTGEEIAQIEIAHSMPRIVYPEVEGPVTWTIECRIPLSLLEKYTPVTRPARGKSWKANLYKTGSRTSNPNYLTWSPVEFPRPNFHLPQYFGTLSFR